MIRSTQKSGPATGRREICATLRRIGSALLLLLAAAFASAPAGAQTATSGEIDGVLELFTSQGCSSCPPADRVLSAYARENRILALSYHVDYWDYIGWKDPLGSRQNTERQRAYGKAFGTGSVYTPQMIVNGREELVGSDRARVRSALGKTRLPGEAEQATVRLAREGAALTVFAQAPSPAPGTEMVLVLVTYRGETITRVVRGENEGHELRHSHSVRDWRVVGRVSGKPIEIEMPVSMLADPDSARTGCAAFLQVMNEDGAPGRIVAAAKLDLVP